MNPYSPLLKRLRLDPLHEVPTHPLAALFPMEPAAFISTLADSIRQDGLHSPITRCKGGILDGRSRYLACLVAGVEPRFEEFEGNDDDAFELVVSKNLLRKNMNKGQRAIAAARLANVAHGGDRKSDQGANLRLETTTQGEAAASLGVSKTSLRHAKRVLDAQLDKLTKLVCDGEVSVSLAATACDYVPREKLEEIIQIFEPRKELQEAVRIAKGKNATKSDDAVVVSLRVDAQFWTEFEEARTLVEMSHGAFLKLMYQTWRDADRGGEETAEGEGIRVLSHPDDYFKWARDDAA